MFFYEIWQKIINVHGVVAEFGTRYGDNLSLFTNLRGMLEPFNRGRKILGFDTFEGFIKVSEKDGSIASEKDLSTTPGYESYLSRVLQAHEANCPISHLQKFEIIKGDAPLQLEAYLKKHPETIFAFCYFDMDLYEPTMECLNILKSRVTKGTIIGFDQVCYETFPGETLALMEVFGLANITLKRSPLSSSACYFEIS
ncbi:MAG: crotonobetainyl-CoA--carnitine CoA-transferase [SAR324 cluster bacterium]|nr:crotonobetainyl-CoA--carnitine CoA-transferase [SAR324 cluster bacterium]